MRWPMDTGRLFVKALSENECERRSSDRRQAPWQPRRPRAESSAPEPYRVLYEDDDYIDLEIDELTEAIARWKANQHAQETVEGEARGS